MSNAPVRLGNIRLGFEAECFIDQRKLDNVHLDTGTALSQFVGSGKRINDQLGEGKLQHPNYSHWNLTDDSTIITPNTSSTGVEIISPILSYPQFSSSVDNVFSFISSFGGTNESCGFHIGVSLDGVDLSEKLDLLKLVVFIGEAHIAEMFARFDNQYAQLLEPFVSDYLSSFHDIEDQIKELVKRPLYSVSSSAEYVIPWDKYFSFNFTKIKTNNYIEFRLIGCADYHKKIKEVLIVARRLAWAVAIACDPEAHTAEYVNKLLRIAKLPSVPSVSNHIRLKLSGGTCTVDVPPPADAYARTTQSSHLIFTAKKISAGSYELNTCSTDDLSGVYRDSVYYLLTSGVGGNFKFSIDPQADRSVFWVMLSLLDLVTANKALLYLLTACPSLFYVLASDTSSKAFERVKVMSLDSTTAIALRRALAKCDLTRVVPVYYALNMVPTHIDPARFVAALDSAELSLLDLPDYSKQVPSAFASPLESFVYLDDLAHKYRDLGVLLSVLVSLHPGVLMNNDLFPNKDADNLVRILLEQCPAEYDPSYAVSYLEELASLLQHYTTDDLPFFFHLFDIGVALDHPYVFGLVTALKRYNVDKSWTNCLQLP